MCATSSYYPFKLPLFKFPPLGFEACERKGSGNPARIPAPEVVCEVACESMEINIWRNFCPEIVIRVMAIRVGIKVLRVKLMSSCFPTVKITAQKKAGRKNVV